MQIFKAGKRPDANGQVVELTEADLQKTASAYDPSLHEAPIVVGHPATNDPAYGWVQSLRTVGQTLEAVPQQIDPAFSEIVKAGRYKKISASFYTPTAPANPVPGVYYLRHVGFLGAVPPAVKGLKQVEFSEQEEGVIEFSDWDVSIVFRNLRDWLIDQFGLETADRIVPSYVADNLTMDAMRPVFDTPTFSEPMPPEPDANNQTTEFSEREAALTRREQEAAAREAALNRSEIVQFVEGLVGKGTVLPASKQRVIELLAACPKSGEIEFSEGETPVKGTVKDLFKSFLESLPKSVEYSEVAGNDKPDKPTNPEEIARKVTEYREQQKAKGNEVSFSEAYSAVMGG